MALSVAGQYLKVMKGLKRGLFVIVIMQKYLIVIIA
jgi:hypothetical protein